MSWRPIGAVLPGMLTAARVELHWAAQLPSSPGTTWLPPQADFSHTNLGWEASLGLLAGRPVGRRELRAGLVFENLELVVLDGREERETFRLPGRDMRAALAWLGEQIDPERGVPSVPEHDMPQHSVGLGAPFPDGDSPGRRELAAWFANASSAIHRAVHEETMASVVRCWPHHFDVASLVVVDPEANAETARSIGVGFSPGDGAYDQPYFYVTPWPYPSVDVLPDLPGVARWHTSGWIGVVLTGDQIMNAGESHQGPLVDEELQQAIDACHQVLSD